MHIETWKQLIVFIQYVLPVLSPKHKSAGMYIKAWCETNYGKIDGIDVDPKRTVITWLREIKPTIPDSWSDEISEASMFMARLNTAPAADKWHTEAGCSLWGNYWYAGTCHAEPPKAAIACRNINNQAQCVAAKCYWYNGLCHSEVEPEIISCSDHRTQNSCLSAGCYWYNGTCHPTPEPVKPPPPPPPPPPKDDDEWATYKMEVRCLAAGFYWWEGACHENPKVVTPGVPNPVKEFSKQVSEYCATIPLTRPLEIINCGILTAILKITADVFDFLGAKR